MAAPAKRAREDGYGAGDGKNSGAAGAGAGAGASDDPSQASGAAHMSRHLKAIMDAADTFLQAHVRSPDTPREARAVVSAVQVTKLVDDTGGSLEEVLVSGRLWQLIGVCTRVHNGMCTVMTIQSTARADETLGMHTKASLLLPAA